jgi:hypothetical protein
MREGMSHVGASLAENLMQTPPVERRRPLAVYWQAVGRPFRPSWSSSNLASIPLAV